MQEKDGIKPCYNVYKPNTQWLIKCCLTLLRTSSFTAGLQFIHQHLEFGDSYFTQTDEIHDLPFFVCLFYPDTEVQSHPQNSLTHSKHTLQREWDFNSGQH